MGLRGRVGGSREAWVWKGCEWFELGPMSLNPLHVQLEKSSLQVFAWQLMILVWLPSSRSSNRAPRAPFPSVDLLVWTHSPGTLRPPTPLIRSGGGPGM